MNETNRITKTQIHFLQINLGHRLWAHEALMKWLSARTDLCILCLQEPYLTKKGLTRLPNNYGAFWQQDESREQRRVRACIIAPYKLLGYMVTQRSSIDLIMVRFDTIQCTVISAYFAGDKNINEVFGKLEAEIRDKNELICCCDTNAYHWRWGSNVRKNQKWKAKVRGKELVELIDEHGLIICNSPPHLPTFVRDSSKQDSSHIDATFCTYGLFNRIARWGVRDETYLSDHRAIEFIMECQGENLEKLEEKQFGTAWKKPNSKMKGIMENQLQRRVHVNLMTGSTEAIDSSINKHAEDIRQVLTEVFKKKGKRKENENWWTEEVKRKYWELRLARKRMRKYRHEDLKLRFWECRREFRRAAQAAKIKAWRDFTTAIEDPWGKLIKIVRATAKGKIQSRTLHDLTGEYASDMNDTLYYLGKQFYPPPAPKTETQLEIENYVEENLTHYVAGPKFTICEMREALKLMRNASAPGFDQITNNVIKCLMGVARNEKKYLAMYNTCLANAYFPTVWKTAKVVLIPKSAVEQNSVKAFRPISLTSSFSKLFERMVLARILHHLACSNVLAANQHAYTKGRSTETALFELFEVVQSSLHNTGATKNICVVLFLDISGAFDRTWHQGILFKLLQYGIPKYLIAWLRDFLEGRKAFFSDSNKTYEMDLQQGCPQGGVLSPILWNILFNDLLALPVWIGKNRHNRMKVIGYADDAAIICKANTVQEASELINIHLKKIADWSQEFRVKFNPSKLAALVLSNKTEKQPPVDIFFENTRIKEVTEFKYLGLILDTKCTWKSHINSVLGKLTLITRSLYGLSQSNWGVNLEVYRLLYHAIFLPVMTYGISIWGWKAAQKSVSEKFDKQIRNFALLATKCLKSTSSTYLFALLNTPNFTRILEFQVLKTSVQQFQILQTARKTVYDNYASKRISREVPQSMDHYFYMNRRPVQNELSKIEFYDIKQQLLTHPSNWVSTKTVVEEKPLAIVKGACSWGWVLYTDASKCTFGIGWSFVVFKNGLFVHKDMGALTDCTIFNAEAFAMLQAVKYARSISVRQQEEIEIRTDSLGLVRALQNEYQQTQMLCDIKKELREFNRNGKILLRWVPAHQDIEGNEWADSWAKRATDAKNTTRINYSKAEINRFLDRKRKAEATQDWENFRSRNVKFFLPDVTAVQKFIKSSPSAPLCQIVSGHSRLNDFLCEKLGVLTSSWCNCGKAKETITHYLLECELYEEIRNQVWPEFEADMSFITRDWKLLNEFVLKTGRFNLNVRELLLKDTLD